MRRGKKTPNCAKRAKTIEQVKGKGKKKSNHWLFIYERFGCNGCIGCNRDGSSSLFHVTCAKAAYALFVFEISHFLHFFFCFFLHLYVSFVSTDHEGRTRTWACGLGGREEGERGEDISFLGLSIESTLSTFDIRKKNIEMVRWLFVCFFPFDVGSWFSFWLVLQYLLSVFFHTFSRCSFFTDLLCLCVGVTKEVGCTQYYIVCLLWCINAYNTVWLGVCAWMFVYVNKALECVAVAVRQFERVPEQDCFRELTSDENK